MGKAPTRSAGGCVAMTPYFDVESHDLFLPSPGPNTLVLVHKVDQLSARERQTAELIVKGANGPKGNGLNLPGQTYSAEIPQEARQYLKLASEMEGIILQSR